MTAPARLRPDIYLAAEQLLAHNRPALVAGGTITPQWIDRGARFWYSVQAPDHVKYVLVDPATRTKTPAFDCHRLASSLEDACGLPADPANLPLAAIELAPDAVEFDALGARWRCELGTYTCEQIPARRHDPMEAASPDKRWAVVRRRHDLWLRERATGRERLLTSDGTAECEYGTQPDALSFGVLMRKLGLPCLPPIVAWSPDSRKVISHSIDQRGVGMAHLVESAPASSGRPILHSYHYAVPGDEVVPRARLVVFDTERRTAISARGEALLAPMFSPILWKRLQWAPDSSAAYYLSQSRDLRTLQLVRLDPDTGGVRPLVTERGEPRAEPSQYMGQTILRVLSTGREVLWYSQRDGWGHLYLYDTESGELRNQVTDGSWAVRQILHVDEAQRVVYFVASGLVADDPYRRQVCRANLDGTEFARLSADDLDHVVTVPENELYFIDSASTLSIPPVTTVRGWNGEVLVELERADIGKLLATGWTPPERFAVKAADQATDIYGVLYTPHDLDPLASYPVLDNLYPGPQRNRVQPCFGGDPKLDAEAEAIAALGFAVVAIDGRGTPGRDKAFHDLSYGHYSDAGCLEDHVAAIRQLSVCHPWLDLSRVGAYGRSSGGYATVRAMCAFPGFYKVGVATCGNHDQRYYQLAWGETYDGPLDPDTYARSSNAEIAHQLVGKLLLIHGEMDDNVHPQLTLRLVDRLIAANKDFDLLIIPGAEHTLVGYEAYETRRRWDYLVRHLLDAEPPPGYQLSPFHHRLTSFFDAI
jgi:dipeptidyl-peptidase 4